MEFSLGWSRKQVLALLLDGINSNALEWMMELNPSAENPSRIQSHFQRGAKKKKKKKKD